MRTFFYCLTAIQFALAGPASAADFNKTIKVAAEEGKYTYVMFYRAEDTATRQMSSVIGQQVSKTARNTNWIKVGVTDQSAADVVKKYDASRLPMPTVIGVAPNGAVTGVFQMQVNQQQLDNAILTPRYSEMVKKLQEQKIAVVCLQPAGGNTLPVGIKQLEADTNLKNHVVKVTASADDAKEARFFERMGVKTDIKKPAVLVFAPPGVFVGRFDENVSGQQLASAIHKSGQCSCQHCQSKNK
ncbi:MAG: hypothetical protein ABJZ55_03310 [Fuerstiella sp.]